MNEWIGLVVAYVTTRPFFLIFLAGGALGVAVRFAVPWPRWNRGPLVTRKRRNAVLPLALASALVLSGGAMLLNPFEVLAWWWGGVALMFASGLLVWATFAARGLLRTIAFMTCILPLVYGFALWAPIERAEVRFSRNVDDSIHVVLASTDEVPGGVLPDGRSHPLTVGLLRIDLSEGSDGGRLDVRFAPVLPLEGAPDDMDRRRLSDPPDAGVGGVWSQPLHLAVDQSITIRVTTRRNPPPLWWFPPPGRVVTVAVTASGSDRADILYRRRSSPIPVWSDPRTYPRRGFGDRNAETEWPVDGAGYLQPGFYTLSVVGENE